MENVHSATVWRGVYCVSMDKKNTNEMNFDFDLPEVEGAKVVKPRVHIAGDSVCTSCEA